MKKIASITLLLIITTLCNIMLYNNKSVSAEEWRVTGNHRAITQVSEWLNTSRNISAEELRGRIILLDFWTYCCINCIHIIPELQKIEHKFGNKLTVIGIHSAKFQNEKDSKNIRNAIIRYDIPHPVVNDADFKIWNDFSIRAWPSMVLISPDGKIYETYSGEDNQDKITEDIEELIEDFADKGLVTEPLPIELEKTKAESKYLSFPGKIEYTKNFNDQPTLFISDSSNNRIVVVNMDGQVQHEIGSGKVGLTDGDFKTAEFNTPQGLLFDDQKQVLYVADTDNHALREIDFNTKQVTTLAGRGKRGFDRTPDGAVGTKIDLASPWDLEFLQDRNHIAIAMAGTHQLWTYRVSSGVINLLAGNGRESIDDGIWPFNSLSQPSGLSKFEDTLYFVDSETSSLRIVDEDEEVKTLIGTGLFDFGFNDGKQGEALMQHAIGVHADHSGVYIADSYNHAIRKYDPDTELLTTVYGNGKSGELNEPNDVVKIGNKLYIADTNNSEIKIFDQDAGKLTLLNLIPPESEQSSIDANLPNLIKIKDPIKISSDKDLSGSIKLKDNWKINDLAPTWLTLFDNDSGKPVQKFSYDNLKDQSFSLNKLEKDKKYRLQGTIYHCEDKVGSICLINSYDAIIEAEEGSEVKDLILNIAK